MSEVHTIQLNQSWFWKQRDITISSVLDELELSIDENIQDGWTVAQAYPSEVHVELLKKKLIPDPYVGFNEHKVQCTCFTSRNQCSLCLRSFNYGQGSGTLSGSTSVRSPSTDLNSTCTDSCNLTDWTPSVMSTW